MLLGAFAILYLIDFMVGRANAKNEVKMAEMKESYEVQLRHAKLREYMTPGYVPTADEENMLLKFIAKIEECVSDSELSVESLASFMCMSRCNLPLVDVAEQAGFSSTSYFCSSFKKQPATPQKSICPVSN